jgi:NhaA family Na+:H+ antiporter
MTQAFIIPTFAFFNSGISVGCVNFSNLISPVYLGVSLGLFFGKQIGIVGSFYLLVKSGAAVMPAKSNFKDVYISAVLCGIGFTMSIFVSSLAFDPNSIQMTEAKLGILSGSLLAFLYGGYLLYYARPAKATPVSSA